MKENQNTSIKIDPSSLHLTKKEVDTNRFEQENIPGQYDSLADGLQKEAIQNAWDARIGNGQSWKIVLSYDSQNKIFSAEDSGTTGVEDWEFYNGIGFTSKEVARNLGSRGQGKALLAACGEHVVTETITEKGHECSIWLRGQYASFEKNELEHRGTLIRVYNVKDEIAKELKDDEKMIRFVQLTWNELLKRKNVEIIYRGKKERVIKPIQLPSHTESKEFEPIVVKRGNKKGTISNITIYLAKKEFPDNFSGIAMNVGVQTIRRYLPTGLGPHSKRVFGFCDVSFLAPYEHPNHSEFRSNEPLVLETKAYLRKTISKFLEPLIERKKEVDEKVQKTAEDVVDLVNRCLGEDFSDLDPQGKLISIPPKGKRGKKIKHKEPYISWVTADKKEYSRGEVVKISATTKNPSKKEFPDCGLHLTVIDSTHSEVLNQDEILNYTVDNKHKSSFSYHIANSAPRGNYVVKALLKDSAGHKLHRAFASFDVDPEPRQPGDMLGRRKGLKRCLFFEFEPQNKGETFPETYYDEDEYAVVVNMSHPSFKAVELSKLDSVFKLHLIKCIVSELLTLRFRKDLKLMESDIAPSEIEDLYDTYIQRWQSFLATCVDALLRLQKRSDKKASRIKEKSR